MERLFWICIAGALGTGCRYLVAVWSAARFGVNFPYGTWFVNIVGCFSIALIMRLSLAVSAFPEGLRLALTTGFLGGLTTYSSFNYETTKLLLEGKPAVALLNIGATLAGCFLAGLLGLFLATRLTQS